VPSSGASPIRTAGRGAGRQLGVVLLVVVGAFLGLTCDEERLPCGGAKDECPTSCNEPSECVEGPDGALMWECACDPAPGCGPPPPITDCGPLCSMSVQCVDGSWTCELCQPCRNRTDTCEECRACEVERECLEQNQVCRNSDACRAIADCAASCTDTACIDACIAVNPSGQVGYESLDNCVCHHCSTRCPGVCGG